MRREGGRGGEKGGRVREEDYNMGKANFNY